MKKVVAVLALVGALTASYSMGRARQGKPLGVGYLNGDSYARWDDATRATYVLGFMNGLTAATYLKEPDRSGFFAIIDKCAEGRPIREIREWFTKFIEGRPFEQDHPLSELSTGALLQFCPAPK